MNTQMFIKSFAQHLGLKEGIILSEMCRIQMMKKEEVLFSFQDLKKQLDFFSEKQIRTSLKKLIEKRCLSKTKKNTTFDRTLVYYINSSIFGVYLEETNYNRFYDHYLTGVQ